MYSQKQTQMNRDNLIGAIGILIPGGVSVYTFVEQIKPVLGVIALVVSIAVGITVLILNIKKIRKLNRENINNMALKHPQAGSRRGKKEG